MKTFWACLVLLMLGVPAMAQSDQPAPIVIDGVTFSGNIRERYEAWDWFSPAGRRGEISTGIPATLMRFAFSQEETKIRLENRDGRAGPMLGLPNGAVLPAPQGQLGLGANYYAANDKDQYTAFIFPKQAYVRFKWDHSSLQAGRFEFTDGNEVKSKDPTVASLVNERIAQRLIGTFGFTDVMRSFDGLHYSYTNGPWNFTAVSAIPDARSFPGGRLGLGGHADHLRGCDQANGIWIESCRVASFRTVLLRRSQCAEDRQPARRQCVPPITTPSRWAPTAGNYVMATRRPA